MMSESDEAIAVDEPLETAVVEVDLDAETTESVEAPSEADTEGDQQKADDEGDEGEVAHPEPDDEAETPSTRPFSFAVDGTRYDVPGAVLQELDDGEGGKEEWIAMPRSAFQESVQPHVADRRSIQRQEAAYKRTIAELDPTTNPAVVEARALLDSWDEVLKLEPDDLAAWVEDGKANMGRLRLEAENKALRADRESANNAEPDYTEFIETLEGDVSEQVKLSMERLEVDLPLSVQREVSAHLWKRVQNGEAIYVEGENHGLQPGEWGVQLGIIDEAVKLFRGTREAGARKAERKNAPKPKAPRTVEVAGSPAPSGEDKEMTKQEWLNEMGLNQ